MRLNLQAGVALLDQAVVSGANFIFLIAAAKCLPIEQFGTLSLAWIVMNIVLSFHMAGILQPLAIMMPASNDRQRTSHIRLLNAIHWWVIAVLGGFAVVAWFLPAMGCLVSAIILCTAVRQGCEFRRRVHYNSDNTVGALYVDLLVNLPVILVGLYLIFHPTSLALEVLVLIPASAASVAWIATSFGAIGRDTTDLASPIETVAGVSTKGIPDEARRIRLGHWQYGKWSILNQVLFHAGAQMLPFMVAGILGLREAAAMAAARSIMGITNIFFSGMEAYAIPRARRAFIAGGWIAIKQELLSVSGLFAVTVFPFLVACLLVPKPIMALLLSHEYLEYSWVLQTYAMSYMFLTIWYIASFGLFAMGLPQVATVATAINAGIMLSSGIAVVHWRGLPGALALVCLATLILAVTGVVGVMLAARRSQRGQGGIASQSLEKT